MNRTIVWILAFAISNSAVFLVGKTWGSKVEFERITRGLSVANASVEMAHYSILRDIAVSLKSGDNASAECQAEMSATSMLDGIKDCLATADCREAVTPKFREIAPELLGEAPLPINRRTECPASPTRGK